MCPRRLNDPSANIVVVRDKHRRPGTVERNEP